MTGQFFWTIFKSIGQQTMTTPPLTDREGRCLRHPRSAVNPAARLASLSRDVEHRLTYACQKPMHDGAETQPLGRAPPSPTAAITTRPQGGAVTEWYKGKTGLPVWRQILTEICRCP